MLLYDTKPQPGDGQNLALSVAKWKGKAGIPGKRFVIWAIGSSWTEAQRDGYGLIYAHSQEFRRRRRLNIMSTTIRSVRWDDAVGWASG